LAFGVFAFLGFCLLLFFCWVLNGVISTDMTGFSCLAPFIATSAPGEPQPLIFLASPKGREGCGRPFCGLVTA
jgi:hypothetical protein